MSQNPSKTCEFTNGMPISIYLQETLSDHTILQAPVNSRMGCPSQPIFKRSCHITTSFKHLWIHEWDAYLNLSLRDPVISHTAILQTLVNSRMGCPSHLILKRPCNITQSFKHLSIHEWDAHLRLSLRHPVISHNPSNTCEFTNGMPISPYLKKTLSYHKILQAPVNSRMGCPSQPIFKRPDHYTKSFKHLWIHECDAGIGLWEWILHGVMLGVSWGLEFCMVWFWSYVETKSHPIVSSDVGRLSEPSCSEGSRKGPGVFLQPGQWNPPARLAQPSWTGDPPRTDPQSNQKARTKHAATSVGI